MKNKALLAVFSLIVGLLAGVFLPSVLFPRMFVKKETVIKRDTVYRIDSNRYDNPQPLDVDIVEDDSITVLKPGKDIHTDSTEVSDTLGSTDSTEVFHMERKVYGDSTYRLQISGYRPRLDWIETYGRNTQVTEYVAVPDDRRHCVSIEASVMYLNRIVTPLTVNYTYDGGKYTIGAGAGYDFMSNTPVLAVRGSLKIKRW